MGKRLNVVPEWQLQDPELVTRWKRVVHVITVLPKLTHGMWIFESAVSDKMIIVRHTKRGDMAFVRVVDNEDVDRSKDEFGTMDEVVFVEYKLDLKVPFVIRTVEIVNMEENPGKLRVRLEILRKVWQRLKLMPSGLLEPTSEQLDELLLVLEDVEPRFIETE